LASIFLLAVYIIYPTWWICGAFHDRALVRHVCRNLPDNSYVYSNFDGWDWMCRGPQSKPSLWLNLYSWLDMLPYHWESRTVGLELNNPLISDRDLGSLKGFRHLEYVNLFGSHVSEAAVKQLSLARPKMIINTDRGTWQAGQKESRGDVQSHSHGDIANRAAPEK